MQMNVKMKTNSEINSLNNLDATFPDLSQALLTWYSTGVNKVYGKTTIYRSCLASFTVENEYPKACYFGDHLLPLIGIYICSDATQFNVFVCFESE